MPPRMPFLSSSLSLRCAPRLLRFVRAILTGRLRTVAAVLVELPLKFADTLFELQKQIDKGFRIVLGQLNKTVATNLLT